MDVKKEHMNDTQKASDMLEKENPNSEALSEELQTQQKKQMLGADVMQRIKEILFGLLYMLGGALLGGAEFLFGARPFGIAFLCASSKKTGYIYAGLILSAIITLSGTDMVVYICTYTALLFIRVISRLVIDSPWTAEQKKTLVHSQKMRDIYEVLFSEHIFLRMATSCVGAFATGIYTLVSEGFLYYDLYGTIAGMILSPLCVFLLWGLFDKDHSSDAGAFAGICALSSMLVVALESIEAEFYGVPLSLVGAMLITLYMCRKKSILHGLIIGVFCGLVYSPIFAPSFAFAAIAAGALWNVSVFFACISAFGVSLAWGLYVEGISALTEIMPAFLAATLFYAVMDKLFFSKAKKETVSAEAETAETEQTETSCVVLGKRDIDTLMLEDTEKKIETMREAFSSLSELFYGLSERMRMPSNSDLKQICDNAFDACCQSCEHRDICWEVEYASTLATVGRTASVLGQRGRVDTEDIPKRLVERCSSMPEIIDQINRNGALHIQQLLEGDKTEIFALDYEAVSKLLGEALNNQDKDFAIDAELSRAFCDEISQKCPDIEGVVAFGDGKKRLLVRSPHAENIKNNIEQLQSIASRLFSQTMNAEVFEEEDGGAYAVISRAKSFSVESAKRTCPAQGGDGFCGDTVNIFDNGDDIFYSLISDGMGSGRDAAFTSGICSLFLSKILSSTDRCDISFKMLNSFLRNKGSGSMHECSATVDLMEFDTVSGKATFYKGGAAPSYVFRDGNLFKIRSNTVPLGIISELEANKISLDMGNGDIVVMISDGVTRSYDECPWLFELLGDSVESESLASIADRIVKRAKYEGADDDISVIVMKINEIC